MNVYLAQKKIYHEQTLISLKKGREEIRKEGGEMGREREKEKQRERRGERRKEGRGRGETINQLPANQITNGGHLARWLLPVTENDSAKRIAK